LPNDANGPRLVVVPGPGGSAPFAISRSEIAISDYNLFCSLSSQCSPLAGNEDLPATRIGAADMQAYAAWLSSVSGQRYSLPTHEQWRHAANGGDGQINPNINCVRRSGGKQVDGFELQNYNLGGRDWANSWGLRQVVGNAEEVVTSGGSFLSAGGAYTDRVQNCTVDFSRAFGGAAEQVGFRVVRNVD
jgi:formylglycine-generating enzyme required for sulfatase activity